MSSGARTSLLVDDIGLVPTHRLDVSGGMCFYSKRDKRRLPERMPQTNLITKTSSSTAKATSNPFPIQAERLRNTIHGSKLFPSRSESNEVDA